MGRIQWCLVACVVLLAVIGEVTDARGQIEWNYGPKDRRKRQITINGGNTRGPLAGFLGQLARPSDKEENKPTPLGFIGGIIGGAINEFSTHAGNLAEHLAGQNPFFNGAWNNQGGISFPPANQGTDEDTSAEDTGSDSDREEFCKKRRNRGRRRCRPCRSQPGGCNRPNRPDRPDRPQEINENIPKGCGALSKQLTRIVGGQPADKGEWPWMAALLRDSDDQYCGGVLVTDQHILSAAHCVDNFKASDITIRLGEYDFEAPSNSRRDFDVERIYMHERYNRKTYENDIALLKLKKATTFNNDIWPICLPPPNVKLEGKSAYVTGWGTTSYSGQSSKVLLEVFLPIWKNSDCKRAYTQTITDKQVCAGYRQGGKDSCQGDSGGPLMYQMSTGRWAVVGVVSWGIRCAEKDKPGVYSRVDSYSDWIKDKVLA